MLYTDLPQNDSYLFSSLSMPHEIFVSPKEAKILDYMVTEFPRSDYQFSFSFVYGVFEPANIAFAANQADILTAANDFFKDSVMLSDVEQRALNQTFKRTIKLKPTLPGRK